MPNIVRSGVTPNLRDSVLQIKSIWFCFPEPNDSVWTGSIHTAAKFSHSPLEHLIQFCSHTEFSYGCENQIHLKKKKKLQT